MAVPASNQLSLIGIFDELNVDDYNDGNSDGENNISLKECSEGDVSSINLGNVVANRPDGSAPHEMSEFYSYDHDAVKSDIRLKTNIQLLGHSDLNIPIYSFNFKDNQKVTYRGVMAQDLIKMGYDDSVVMGDDGFYSVNYNDIDVDFKVL